MHKVARRNTATDVWSGVAIVVGLVIMAISLLFIFARPAAAADNPCAQWPRWSGVRVAASGGS
jgi:hypothetical protein